MKKRVLAFLIAAAMTIGAGAVVYGGDGQVPPVIPCPPETRTIVTPYDDDTTN